MSQHLDTRCVVQGLLIKLTSPDADQREKIERVYEIQKEKKCLVIADDLWRREDWECLRPTLISTT